MSDYCKWPLTMVRNHPLRIARILRFIRSHVCNDFTQWHTCASRDGPMFTSAYRNQSSSMRLNCANSMFLRDSSGFACAMFAKMKKIRFPRFCAIVWYNNNLSPIATRAITVCNNTTVHFLHTTTALRRSAMTSNYTVLAHTRRTNLNNAKLPYTYHIPIAYVRDDDKLILSGLSWNILPHAMIYKRFTSVLSGITIVFQ